VEYKSPIVFTCGWCGEVGEGWIDFDLPADSDHIFSTTLPEGWVVREDYFCSELCRAKKEFEIAEKELKRLTAEEGE